MVTVANPALERRLKGEDVGEVQFDAFTRGRYATEPVTFSVIVRLSPAVDDRWLDVTADGTAYLRRQGFTLHGERSFHIKEVQFRELPAGCYGFVAEVREVDQDGPIVARAEAPGTLTVLGPDVDVASCD